MSGFTTFANFGSSVMGTMTSAMGSKMQVESDNFAKEWNAQQAEYAAKLAEQKADQLVILGEAEKKGIIKDYKEVEAQQRAEYGAAGVDVNVGSALAVQMDTAREGVYEGQKAKYERDMQAWELRQQARGAKTDAMFLRAAKGSPSIAFASTFTSGITNALGTISSWRPASSGKPSGKISEVL